MNATRHSDQTTPYLTPMHAEADVRQAAQQLPRIDRWATQVGPPINSQQEETTMRTFTLRRSSVFALGAALSIGIGIGIVACGGNDNADPEGPSIIESMPTPSGLTAEPLTVASFRKPSAVVRPQYRYWVPNPPPAGGLDPAVMRRNLADMVALGAGGVEMAALASNGSNLGDAWGSPTFVKSFNSFLRLAHEIGLEVSATVGPAWPARSPLVDRPDHPDISKGLYTSSEVVPAGTPSTVRNLISPTGFTAGATPRLVAVVAAQCTNATCTPTANVTAAGSPRTTLLDRATARKVSVTKAGSPDLDTDDTYVFQPATTGSANAWAVMAFWQAAESTPTAGWNGPSYLVDHLSVGGAKANTDYWDQSILSFGGGADGTRALIDRMGGIQLFEDSLELSDRLKWTDTMVDEWKKRRGYDPTEMLPALAETGAQSCGTFANGDTGVDCNVPPIFDFSDDSGATVRADYRRTFSDLYIANRIATFQRWGDANNIRIKAQAFGEPIDTSAASTVVDVPESESLGMTNNPEYHKTVAVGAHMSGMNAVSAECCAVRRTPYGVDLKRNTRYLNSALSGGVTTIVWHGYNYPYDAGNTTWPGWHSFGPVWADALGERNPNSTDYAQTNLKLARMQLVLRQGKPRFDVAVYRDDSGLISTQGTGRTPSNNSGPGMGWTFYEGSQDGPDTPPGSQTVAVKTALNANGFTYEYVSPEHLRMPLAVWDGSRLFPQRSSYKAMVLNNVVSTLANPRPAELTIRADAIEKILSWAEQGMPLVIIGDLPKASPSAHLRDEKSARVARAAERLTAMAGDSLYKVAQVSAEAAVPAALQALRVPPAIQPQSPSTAILPVRREAGAANYYQLFNQSPERVDQLVTLEGAGRPHLLNTDTGEITPIPVYRQRDGRVTLRVNLGAQQSTTIALDDKIENVTDAKETAESTTAPEAILTPDGGLAIRSTVAGTFETATRSAGVVSTTISAPLPVRLGDAWQLAIESWQPDPATSDPIDTLKRQLPAMTLTASDGVLPSWKDLPAVGPDISGVGTYTQSLTVPEGGVGIHLDLGNVTDSVKVFVNGAQVPVDQANTSRIDIGRWLQKGDNELKIVVATRLLNAMRAAGITGYTGLAVEDAGLMGPVTVTAYRQVLLSK